jgi:hypothetical protein
MDAVQEWGVAVFGQKVEEFMIFGASKRGVAAVAWVYLFALDECGFSDGSGGSCDVRNEWMMTNSVAVRRMGYVACSCSGR